MRVPMSWLREYVDLPADVTTRQVAAALVRAGLEVETVEEVGRDVAGVVVGRVLDVEELGGFKKPIRFCHVDAGEPGGARDVVCGATNLAAGDLVAFALPGADLPGGVHIASRQTYDRTSDGMICSARELGLSDEHAGILVLPPDTPVGVDVVERLGLRDEVLDIAVTPDRGYCWSVRGVAREAATAFEVAFRDPADVPVPAAGPPPYPVEVDDPTGCARYTARAVSGLDPAATTPAWLARRLTLAGMRPISLPVDVTNYVLLGLGQPLHAFDRARLAGPVRVRRAAAGERLTTLDGVDRALDPADLVIADDSGAIALAGVMGGGPTEVTAATTELLIESAWFDPVTVARTARRHRLGSEASRRYERGVDTDLGPAAAEVAVRLLVELGGATAVPGVTDVDHRAAPGPIVMPADLPARVAGVPYPAEVVQRRLREVGCTVTDSDPLVVTPPSWRPDLTGGHELVEEVVRLQGYDALPPTLPVAPAGRGLTRAQRLRRTVGRTLAATGHVEVVLAPFADPAVLDALGLPPDDRRRRLVHLANPLDDGEPALRSTLLPGLLGAVARNVSRGAADVALFEVGTVFREQVSGPKDAPRLPGEVRPTDAELVALDAALPEQPQRLGVVYAGHRVPASVLGPGRAADWADAVAAVELVAAALRVPGLTREADDHAPWHPGRCAALRLGPARPGGDGPGGRGVLVGHAGELHPRVCEALGLPARTCAAEVDLAPLLAAAVDVVAAPVVSPYPAAVEDVALVVDATVPAGAVEAALRDGAGELLKALRLFDVYAGPPVPPGQRSLAFRLTLRATDRTLTPAEVAAARGAAVAAAATAVGAELRTG